MSKLTQKEAVYKAVIAVVGEKRIPVSETGSISSLMTKELRSQVNAILFEGFRNGTIELGKEYSDSGLKSYVSSVTSNWLRKDKRLNGGVVYMIKNPGSRAGSGDAQLSNLKKLQSTFVEGTVEYNEIQGYIDARLAEINAEKVKEVIDTSVLPADLAAKYVK